KEGVWGKQVRDLGIALLVRKTLPPWHPYQIWRLAKLIKRTAPDLVHIHMAPTVIPAASAARLASVPHLVIQHHNLYDAHWDRQNAVQRVWEFKLTRQADAIIAVSEPVAGCTRERLSLSAEKVITIANGIDLEQFQHAKPHDPRREWSVPP